ncbi:hypothetical protein QS257_09140 [Terrilactibacillus sp. S3-3]|nr:hypothetical protein QS257_09140 [Terrilactibacillus sp. S3-3]
MRSAVYSLPDQATAAIDDGADLVALGREAIIDPDWTQKVKEDQLDQIQVKLDPSRQDALVVPDRL